MRPKCLNNYAIYFVQYAAFAAHLTHRLYLKNSKNLIEDFIHLKDSNETATNKCLIHFEEFFQQQRLSCTTVLGHKYKPNFEITQLNNHTIDVLEEKKLGIEIKSKLNTEQNIAVTTILKAVENEKIEKKVVFVLARLDPSAFLKGP